MSKTSSAVKRRYNAKTYDTIQMSIIKGRKDEIQRAAEAAGESLTAYIMGAVEARMTQEAPAAAPPVDAQK